MTGRIIIDSVSLYDCPYVSRTLHGDIYWCKFRYYDEEKCSFRNNGHCPYVTTLKDALENLGIKTER